MDHYECSPHQCGQCGSTWRDTAELEEKIAQLRLISNVNGDWSMKYSKALERIAELQTKLEQISRIALTETYRRQD